MEKTVNINGREVIIGLVLGDITKLDVDAIVNAAHEALMGGGGVDGAIHRAAGPGLLSECRTISRNSDGVRCNTGDAHITGGHNLLARHVIHTVAPKFVGGIIRKKIDWQSVPLGLTLQDWSLTKNIYKNAKPGTDQDMENCYRNCMALADENKLKSIAFPSLGTGGHAYPLELACPIAIKTTLNALAKVSFVEKVIFVCFSQEDFDFYKTNIEEILGK